MSNESFPIIEPGFILAVKLTAGTTSVLSILGASLIIVTYVIFPNLRTTARQLLISISIADIIVSLSHFVGLIANFERFIYQFNNETWNTSTSDPLCISQAAFSMFGTLASFLLSLAIGVYLVGLVVWKKPHVWKKALPVVYIICWGLPAVMIIPNVVKRYFGFSLGADIGWCYIVSIREASTEDDTGYIVVGVFSYELWVYMVFTVLPLLYITFFVYRHFKLKKEKYKPLLSNVSQSQGEDLKLLLVPFIFLLLRVWSTALDIYVYYGTSIDDNGKRLKTQAAAALVLLAGIGDNGQGLANALLFCVFTKKVREQLLFRCNCKRSSSQPLSGMNVNIQYANDEQSCDNLTISYGSSIQRVAS